MLTPEQEAEYWSLKGEQAGRKKHEEWLAEVDAKILKERLERAARDHHSVPHPDWNQ